MTPPKIVWIYWHQGWDKAPDLIQKCLQSWETLNPGWEIRTLCQTSINDYITPQHEIPDLDNKSITTTSLSDIIRIFLLAKYGGVWVDATLLCRRPLDTWSSLFNNFDFFAVSKPSPERMISSWFLVAGENSYIIQEWKNETIKYWNNRKSTDNYFWFHFLFNDLYNQNPRFKQIWDKTPKLSADPAHFFLPYQEKFFQKIDTYLEHKINTVQSPFYKLSYKYDTPSDNNHTVLKHLMNSTNEVKKIKILIAWYGSFHNSGTLGDYLAVKSLCQYLHENHYDFDCAVYKHFSIDHANLISLEQAFSRQYDVLIFCCGPIIKNHPDTGNLFKHFSSTYKIGISVSLFPKTHENYYNPFDYVLPRENGEQNYDDIAILANTTLVKPTQKDTLTIGLTLRNSQSEYGIENCKTEKANYLLHYIAHHLTTKPKTIYAKIRSFLGMTFSGEKTGKILFIENHLEKSAMSPEEIEACYLSCDLILTTRFHGAMVSLKNNIPVIAVDQIQNGAKVYNLISVTGYPFVWKVNEANPKKLLEIAKELLAAQHEKQINQIKNETEKRAMETLKQLHAHLLAFVPVFKKD